MSELSNGFRLQMLADAYGHGESAIQDTCVLSAGLIEVAVFPCETGGR